MSDDIKISISGTDAQMVSVWQRQQAQILKNQQALIRMGEEGERAGNRVGKGVEGAGKHLVSFIGAITGVGSVVGGIAVAAAALKREYDDLLNRQRKAADAQLALADAQSQALVNLGQDKDITNKNLFQEIRKISLETGVNERDTTMAVSNALSARGDKPARAALDAVRVAQRLSAANPENANQLSGAILDLAKRGKMSEEEAAGVFIGVSRMARVTDLHGTAEHVAPGMLGVMGFGDDISQAGALLSAVSLGEADPTGRRSRTASISLAKQLEERLPQLKNTEERIRFIQQGGAREWKKFFEGGRYRVNGRSKEFSGASFEATALPTIRELLSSDPNAQARKEYEAGLQAIPKGAQALGLFRETVGQIEAAPAMQQLKLDRFFKGRAESERIQDILSGQTAISREGLSDILESIGEGAMGRFGAGLEFEARTFGGATPTEAAAAVLSRRASLLRTQSHGEAAPSPEDLARADKLEAVVAELQKLVKLQEEQNNEGVKVEVKVDPDNQRAKAGAGEGNNRRIAG